MIKLKDLSVRSKMFVLIGIFAFGFVVYGTFSYWTLLTVQIGSPAYGEIVVEKELHTMLHPPRMVLFRSALFTGLMLSETDPAKLQDLVEKTKAMSKVYRETHDKWMPKIQDKKVKQILEEKAYPLGFEYVRIRDNEFIPLIQKGEREKARQLMTDVLNPLLFKHIDGTTEALKAQEEHIKSLEQQSATVVSWRTTLLVLFALITVGGVIALGWVIARSISNPLAQVVAKIKAIALGDTNQQLDYQAKDEVGMLADAFRSLTGYLTDVAQTVNAVSRGNLSSEISPRSQQDMVNNSLKKAVETLHEMNKQTQKLIAAAQQGELSRRGDVSRFEGEYAEIVRGVNQMMDTVATPINEAAEVLEKIANRDLTVQVKGDYQGDFARIKDSVNLAAANLDSGFQQVAVSAEQVASAAGEISSGSQALAQGASEQASTIEEVSSSLQEISSMSRQNETNSKEARSLSDNARSKTQNGIQSMQKLSQAVEKIKTSSDETAKIVKTIEEIAFQTNLLALNAAVEAARAGDAGKGFAVVAEEVRNLAMRSAEAAKTTAQLIEEAVSNTHEGVSLNAEVLQNFEEINSQIEKVSVVVSEIAAASEQQNQGVEQINVAIEQMNGVTQQSAANSEESASAAEELSSQSQEMLSMIGSYNISQSISHTAKTVKAKTPAVKNWSAPKTKRAKTSDAKFEVESFIPFENDSVAVLAEF